MAGWSDPGHRLDAQRLAELFGEVDWQLATLRAPGTPPLTIVVCGGAAMCYQVTWRGTGDVDIMYPPMPAELREAVRAVARRRHLGVGWMNDGPAQFAPYGRHVASSTLYTGEHLTVCAPDNRYLLGMKVHAAREDDVADTIWLMNDTRLHRRADLYGMARAVSVSLGEAWKPSRVQKGFVRRCVRERHRKARLQASSTDGVAQAPAPTELFDGKLSGAPIDARVCPKSVGHNAEPCILRSGHGGHCRSHTGRE